MILLALALAAAPLTKQERAAALLTPEQIAASAMVEGDGAPLDPDIWIETRNFLPKQNNDRWFRARIDKATGAVEYQIYFIITQQRDAFRARELTFETASGLGRAPVDKIDHDVSCPNSICYITEHAVAQLTRADLEYAAKGAGQDWPAKLFGQSDSGEILTFRSEIAGFLLAVDREVAELQARKPQK